MDIGIKFCGGCNCRYDRRKEVDIMKDTLKDIVWIQGNDSSICDIWLLICGCPRCCVSDRGLVARKEVIYVKSPMEFQNVRKRIEKIRQEEGKQHRKHLVLGQSDFLRKKIKEEDVMAFARLTEDDNPMHMNPVFAKNQWFQQPVAHGMFVSSLLSSVMGTKLPGAGTIFMEEHTKFQKPVYFGDVIKAEVTLTDYIEEKRFYVGTFKGICTNQKDEVVVEMTGKQMMMKNLFIIEKEEKNHDKFGNI